MAERQPDEAASNTYDIPTAPPWDSLAELRWDAERRGVAVGGGAEAVEMQHDVLAAGLQARRAVAAVVDRRVPAEHLRGEAVRRPDGRDAVVLGRDHAADRLGAVAERRRAADHLDAPVDEWVDRHGVVLAEIRHVLRADAVLLDPHPGGVEAADDRPRRRAGSVGRRRQAGAVEQRVAQRPRLRTGDVGPGHHRHRREGVGDDGQHPDRNAFAARPPADGAATIGLGEETTISSSRTSSARATGGGHRSARAVPVRRARCGRSGMVHPY